MFDGSDAELALTALAEGMARETARSHTQPALDAALDAVAHHG